jgi:hypothetical protein
MLPACGYVITPGYKQLLALTDFLISCQCHPERHRWLPLKLHRSPIRDSKGSRKRRTEVEDMEVESEGLEEVKKAKRVKALES